MKKLTEKAFIHRMEDFKNLRLDPDRVQVWEDGMRTTGAKGEFEWWYFDSKLSDGTTLVIVFYTKNVLQVNSGLKPLISVTLTAKTGETVLDYVIEGDPEHCYLSKEKCQVKIGDNIFMGNLSEYRIIIKSERVKANIRLNATVQPYRAGTGHAYFQKNKKETYFAWLNPVPQGIVSGEFSIDGKEMVLSGSGYHDHNWGNVSMLEILHNWYWGRAEIGDYTVISSYMTATPQYGYSHGSTFLLTHNDQILAYDPTKVSISFADTYIDKNTKKPVANKIIYDYNDGKAHYVITYSREADISNTLFIDKIRGLKRILGKIAGFDGAYLRFSGQVTLDIYENDKIVKTLSDRNAVWELMYFGHALDHV